MSAFMGPGLTRTNSICPSPEEALLESVKKNDIVSIRTLLRADRDLVEHTYSHPYYRPILPLAVFEEGVEPKTIQTLIDEGARTFLSENWSVLHLAAENPNSDVLRTVIKALGPGDINQVFDGDNALHSLIKSDRVQSYGEGSFVRNVEVLIESGIDVNAGDARNLPAILLAAKAGFGGIVRAIVDRSIQHVDLDTHKFRNAKSARDFIKEKQLYKGPLPGKAKIEVDVLTQIFAAIKESKEQAAIDAFNLCRNQGIADSDDTFSTLLQYCCERGFSRLTRILLDSGADPNQVTTSNPRPPLEIAAENGFYEIIEALLESGRLSGVSPDTVCTLINNIHSDKFEGIDHKQCWGLLIKKIKKKELGIVDLNSENSMGNTPIHYAIRYGGPAITEDLLALGVSLAVKNKDGFMPIEDIGPDLLESHLDSCIKFQINNKNYERSDFEVVFDYNSLIPPRKPRAAKAAFTKDDDEQRSEDKVQLTPEMDIINYMSAAPQFKHLLKHPLIVSFLFLKWQKICWLFFTNLSFYVAFVISLVTYIFTHYGNFDAEGDRSGVCIVLMNITWVTLNITLWVLILRELFQIAISPSRYFVNFENFIEIILIVLTGMILYTQSPSDDARRQISAVAILLGALELILMDGQHPMLTTNVVMFKTVSANFFKLLLWYSLLILAFALSFNVLFAKTGDDEDNVFTGPGSSLFKTIVMLTGEFDAGSINFHTYPITSRLIFTLFVFTITIILLNLLNGLAVNDTQAIKNDAELVGHITRAQHVAYVESMLLGNILPTSLFKLVKNICCCLPGLDRDRIAILSAKPLGKRVCLFPSTNNCVVCVQPNNFGKIYHRDSDLETKSKRQDDGEIHCTFVCSALYLDKETVRRTNEIVKRRREKPESSKVTITHLCQEQVDIKKKLDEILKILTKNNIEIPL